MIHSEHNTVAWGKIEMDMPYCKFLGEYLVVYCRVIVSRTGRFLPTHFLSSLSSAAATYTADEKTHGLVRSCQRVAAIGHLGIQVIASGMSKKKDP